MVINYTLKRSKRKSIAISVLSNCDIVVNAPIKAKRELIESFVYSKAEWISKALEKKNLELSKYNELIENHYTLLNGEYIEIDFEDNINTKIKDNVLYINRKYFDDQQKIKQQISKFYKKLGTVLIETLSQVANHVGLSYSECTLTSAKKKWGSCDTNSRIKLNFRLIMLPKVLQMYVIIHEICHLVEHNHSKRFWELVGKYMPTYKKNRKELKQYSFLNSIY